MAHGPPGTHFPSLFAALRTHSPPQKIYGCIESRVRSPSCPSENQQYLVRIRQCGSQGQTHDCTLTTGSNQDTINTLRDLWMCPKERSSVGQCKKVLFTLFTTLRHYHTNFYPCTFVSIFTKHFPNTWTEISHNTFVPLFACGRFDTMVAFSYLLYVFVAKCHCVLIRL